jgi:hypothetical protein
MSNPEQSSAYQMSDFFVQSDVLLEQYFQEDPLKMPNIDPNYPAGEDDKYFCQDTGAHFEYSEMCKRLDRLGERRKESDVKWERVVRERERTQSQMVNF